MVNIRNWVNGAQTMRDLYKIDDKNRLTLPDDVLKDLDLKTGDHIKFKVIDKKIQLIRIPIPE